MSNERFGYKPFFDSLAWMKKNRGREITTPIGGVMNVGLHKACVVEYKDGGQYVDFVFQSVDRQLHRERTWGSWRNKYKLGTWYELELVLGGDGQARIEAGGGTYKLILLSSGMSIFESDSIRDVYAFVKDENIKLVYLKIKWSREVLT